MATGIDSATNETSTLRTEPWVGGAGVFDPCALQTIGQYMLEGRWVDIRTDEGLIMRVRITEIVVRTEGEEIKLRQEYVDGPEDDPRLLRHEIVVDSDAVWRVLPTNYHVEQVQPWKSKKTGGPRQAISEELAAKIVQQVLDSAVFLYQCKKRDLIQEGNASHRRYVTMLVIFEMTDISAYDICVKCFGYKSPTPMVSAQWRLRRAQNPTQGHRAEKHVTPEEIRRLAELVDVSFEPAKHRSSRTFPNDYTPVLS